MPHYLQIVDVAMHKNGTLNSTTSHERYWHFEEPQEVVAVMAGLNELQSFLIDHDNAATILLNNFYFIKISVLQLMNIALCCLQTICINRM